MTSFLVVGGLIHFSNRKLNLVKFAFRIQKVNLTKVTFAMCTHTYIYFFKRKVQLVKCVFRLQKVTFTQVSFSIYMDVCEWPRARWLVAWI